MKRVIITEIIDPPAFEIEEVDDPEPGEGESLLELVAAEMSPLDRQIATGGLPNAGPPPFVPGASGVARIVSSKTHSPDDIVFVAGGSRGLGNTRNGTMAERFVASDGVLHRIGSDAAPMTVAATASSGITAHLSLFHTADAQPGERALILGATGAVGTAAAQLAHQHGAEVLAAVREPGSYDGPGTVIDVNDLIGGVMGATGGRGADLIVDTIGGPYFNAAILSGAPGCRHVLLGYSAGKVTEFTIPLVMVRQHRILGFNANQASVGRENDVIGTVIDAIGDGHLAIPIRRRFNLEDIGDAYGSLGGGGRVLIVP